MQDGLFFDWYSASVPASPEALVLAFKVTYPHCVWEISRARNGFTHGDCLVDQYGQTVLTMYYGGSRQGSNTFVFASGVHAAYFAETIRSQFPAHQLVRADVAIDYDEAGVWESLYGHALSVSRRCSLKNRYIGEAGCERSATDVSGRTLYVGSRSSVSMIRVYEKGKKDDDTKPSWVRAEFEFKPKGEIARKYFARASIQEIANSTKLGVQFFSLLGVQVLSVPCRPGTVRIKTSHERALDHLKKQYRNILLAELELKGGSYEALGLSLLSDVA